MYIFPECSIGQDTYRGNPWQPVTQNLYAYAGNNPVNYIDPTGHVGRWVFDGGYNECDDTCGVNNDPTGGGYWLVVTIKTYIPYDSHFGFHGDGAQSGSGPDGGTARTTQWMFIDPKGQTVISGGHADPTIYQGPTVPGVIQHGEQAVASGKTLKAEVVQKTDNAVAVHASGNESNPLVPMAPGITYDYNVIAQKDGTVTMWGAHDSFPAHQVWLQRYGRGPELLHSYTPADSLFAPWLPNAFTGLWPPAWEGTGIVTSHP